MPSRKTGGQNRTNEAIRLPVKPSGSTRLSPNPLGVNAVHKAPPTKATPTVQSAQSP